MKNRKSNYKIMIIKQDASLQEFLFKNCIHCNFAVQPYIRKILLTSDVEIVIKERTIFDYSPTKK